STLHVMVASNVITDRILEAVINTFYWLVPHQLFSNLDRDIVIANFHANCATGCPGMQPSPAQYLADQLSRTPGASGSGDAAYWLAYLLVVGAILYMALRRKQV